MSWDAKTLDAVARMQNAQKDLAAHYVGRERAARLLVLAAVSREHLLLLGPPGTAKTDLVTRFAALLKARPFTYLLSRFTEPAEIFGPLDYTLFQKGEYRVRTERMLPDAEFAFLDELFQGSSAILNTLLALLNERVFHNGSELKPVPLISLVGASGEPPDDPALRGFADRFLLRIRLAPVARSGLPELLDLGWRRETEQLAAFDPQADAPAARQVTPLVTDPMTLPSLYRALREVRLDRVRPDYADLIRDLLNEGVSLSDRRVVRGLKLVAAAALLRGEQTAEVRDLWPLAHFWTEPGDEAAVARLVADHTQAQGGDGLEPPRRAAEIVAVAETRAAAVLGNRAGAGGAGGAPGADQVIAVLRDLSQLFAELRRDHPADSAAHGRLGAIRTDVMQLLEDLP